MLAGTLTSLTLLVPMFGQVGTPNSYGQFYQQQIHKSYGANSLIGVNPTAFLWNKYFYHNTNVSPYINLARPDPAGTTNYQAYVLPELKRRDNQMKAQLDRQRTGSVGHSRDASFYHNHWYGGWQHRR